MIVKVNVSQEIDERDQHILALVQRDGKLPQAEIARRVGLSTAAVNERLRKLENAGVIRRYAAVVDPRAVGVTITAFVRGPPRTTMDTVLNCNTSCNRGLRLPLAMASKRW